jgi:hypothetical protein
MNVATTLTAGQCRIDATEIVSRLFIGSAPALHTDLKACGFDSVVLTAEEFQPRKCFGHVRVLHAGFADGPLDGRTLHVARNAAEEVSRRWMRGDCVLVTCALGRNRSGFVCALALMLLFGMSGCEAVHHVRSRRMGALTNPDFARFLTSLRSAAHLEQMLGTC